jgi:hypothetical protein
VLAVFLNIFAEILLGFSIICIFANRYRQDVLKDTRFSVFPERREAV